MEKRKDLANCCRKIYTIYFDTKFAFFEGFERKYSPAHGLKMIASSSDDSYEADNTDDLIKKFQAIAADIKRKEEGLEINLTTSKLQLDTIDNIDNIQIGEETYRGEIFINALKSNAVDGVIDVNKFEYNGKKIFQTSEDIIITYKEL